jgi:hypothetical protein
MKRLVLLAMLVACAPEAPATPSFQQHVLPILAANCVRCHGYPAIGGGPAGLRLDSYTDIAIDDDTIIAGAAINASRIASRIADDARPMPPRFPLDDHQIEIIDNWAAQVPAGELPPRGEPRRDNRMPTIVLTAIEQRGALVTVHARVDDPDGDLVAGNLRATIGGTDRVVGPVRSGTVTAVWDTTALARGSHPLTAYLDDGAGVHVLSLGTITLEAP